MVDSKLARERRKPITTRRYFDEDTKREAVDALLRGDKTRQELCKELEIQPSQLLAWMGQYQERQRAYSAVEQASALSGIGDSLAATIGAGIAGGALPADTTGALQSEIERAVGRAVLKLLSEQRK